MIFTIGLLTCCKTHQSVIEKSTTITTDTTAISQIAGKDSTSLKAKIDSIIIEEYAVDRGKLTTDGHNGPNLKVGSYRNGDDTSQKDTGVLKKKTKIYGANISGTWSSANNTMNKKTAHQQTTNSDIKQRPPFRQLRG